MPVWKRKKSTPNIFMSRRRLFRTEAKLESWVGSNWQLDSEISFRHRQRNHICTGSGPDTYFVCQVRNLKKAD
ncbi:hypothetical protein QE152_g27506 [Popillia japonica]|uniref:Uncharacterized protein n=1 Tax=Popillia japonica TaxID=7064 RepID=A0AAW1JVJ5_POPJA